MVCGKGDEEAAVMTGATWRKYHKWLGYAFCFFMPLFCLSGIVLNHRAAVSDMNVGREWLPARYHYSAWNGGLLRGTTPYTVGDSDGSVLLYGSGGIWRTDSEASFFSDFSSGLPDGADCRQIRNIVQTADRELFAVSLFGLYRYEGKDAGWQTIFAPGDDGELLSDVFCRKDTLLLTGRSYLYLSVAPYTSFRKIQIKKPKDFQEDVSMFRAVWMLHSGELFGSVGKIAVDVIAGVLILLCLTGLMFRFAAVGVRRQRQRGNNAGKAIGLSRLSFLWHDRLGRTSVIFTLLIAVTGWCLRPPAMIPLALTKIPAVPGTELDSENPWNDKLRILRYDESCGDWLLYTSEGFYSLENPDGIPAKIERTPPVSVMGLNVFEKSAAGQWLCGSFSGMFVWDRQRNAVMDYYTHESVEDDVKGPPFGKRAISGFSDDFDAGPLVAEYYEGTDAVPQPEELNTLPMSLWNFALEVHSGRIFIGIAATYVFIFITGIGVVLCLWSGWKIRKRKKAGQRR